MFVKLNLHFVFQKESESMIYLLIVTAFKNRMAISGEQIVLNTLMFAKLVNVVLFYRVDYRLAVLYGLAWLGMLLIHIVPKH